MNIFAHAGHGHAGSRSGLTTVILILGITLAVAAFMFLSTWLLHRFSTVAVRITDKEEEL